MKLTFWSSPGGEARPAGNGTHSGQHSGCFFSPLLCRTCHNPDNIPHFLRGIPCLCDFVCTSINRIQRFWGIKEGLGTRQVNCRRGMRGWLHRLIRNAGLRRGGTRVTYEMATPRRTLGAALPSPTGPAFTRLFLGKQHEDGDDLKGRHAFLAFTWESSSLQGHLP